MLQIEFRTASENRVASFSKLRRTLRKHFSLYYQGQVAFNFSSILSGSVLLYVDVQFGRSCDVIRYCEELCYSSPCWYINSYNFTA